MTQTPTIALTEAEQRLLHKIELDAGALSYDYEKAARNGELTKQLFESLAARRAIPDHRWRFFVDPEYHEGGRGKSRRQIFEDNGCRGRDILRHPHFLKHLRYFLFGPDLPAAAIESFLGQVEDCGIVTSGDVSPLGKHARHLARTWRLEPHHAAEEFYKLSLELGIGPMYAGFMHQAVRQLRYVRR